MGRACFARPALQRPESTNTRAHNGRQERALHSLAAMNAADVTVATMTWARTPAEADLLERALDALTRIGAGVIVADRGSDAAFLSRLQAHRALEVVVATRPGLVAQVQDSVARAARHQTRFLFYTEPDKLGFFEHGLGDFLDRAPAGDDVGVVLAARSPGGFATFPPMQRYTESV